MTGKRHLGSGVVMRGATTVRLGWGVFAAVLLLLVVKVFVADVYHVDSGSMRPTLFGGADRPGGEAYDEWVLVRYGVSAPRRFALVVAKPRVGPSMPVVKRVVGLPGETVLIADGDVLIDGKRLPADAPRPELVTVFDQAVQDVPSTFFYAPERWAEDGDVWSLDASDVPRGANAGMMLLNKGLLDGYLGPRREVVTGTKHVNDGAIECDVRIDELSGAVRFELVEEADTFQALLEPTGAEGGLELRLLRRNRLILQAQGDVAMPAELHRGPVALAAGEWRRVRFSNVDNVLRFALDGELVAEAAYEEGVALERDAAAPAEGGGTKHGGQRAGFGGEGCRARFRKIRVLRDLYYSEKGEFGVRSAVSLGPNEYFLLGDNSLVSQDSRVFGPVQADELLGRPVAVMWPLGGLRRLESPR